jgi:molecular chaperone DnaK (HSP70)
MTDITTTEIVDFLCAAFEAEHGIGLQFDRLTVRRLMVAADAARLKLAVENSVTVDEPFITPDGSGSGLHLKVCITRAALTARRHSWKK